MKKVYKHIIILLVIILIYSCDTAEPPPLPPAPVLDTVTVNIIAQTHRSLTVEVTTTVNNKNWQIELWRNYNNADTLAAEFPVTVGDTTIIDDNNGAGLLLDTEYGYYAVIKDSTGEEEKNRTAMQNGRTLAATSHNYTWKEIAIGDNGYSNVLYDVWGTDENNVYAVGGVRINDTTYGVLHWNGISWEPSKKIGGLEAIYGFSANDIWTVGGGVHHYDGNEWISYRYIDTTLKNNIPYTSLWGTSSSNLYLGSHWGKIIHWDGEKASLENINNEIDIDDMFGLSENNVFAAGNNFWLPGIALEYKDNSWSILPGIDYEHISLGSVYARNENEIYFCGSWVIEYFNSSINHLTELTNSRLYKIRGSSNTADMFAVGYKEVLHNNGINWKTYKEEIANIENRQYNSVFIIGNTVYIVGKSLDNNSAVILIGKK